MHTDRCGNTRRQKRCAKGSGEEIKIHEFNSLLHYAVVIQHTKPVSLNKWLYSATCFGNYPAIIRPIRNSVD